MGEGAAGGQSCVDDLDRALALGARNGADATTITAWRADRGVARLEAGDAAGAVDDLRHAAKTRDAPSDHYRLAVALAATSDWAGARESYDRALATNVQAAWLGERALVLMQVGDDAAAGVDLVRCAQMDPACAETYGVRAGQLARATSDERPRGRAVNVAIRRAAGLALAFAALAGCASRPINAPIDDADRAAATATRRARTADNDPSTMVILAFSGGGTRAAAFSYGVLEELRRTEVTPTGGACGCWTKSTSSPASPAAASPRSRTACTARELFDDYEQRFLKRDVQGDLLSRFLNPAELERAVVRRLGPLGNGGRSCTTRSCSTARRSAISSEAGPADHGHGHRHLDRLAARFHARRVRPHLLRPVDGAAVARGGRVVRGAARAVAGDDQQLRRHLRLPRAELGARAADPNSRARPAGRAMQRLQASCGRSRTAQHRPYLHLVDGGLADNLGMRGVLESMERSRPSRGTRRRTRLDDVAHRRVRRQLAVGPEDGLGPVASVRPTTS